MNGKQVTTNYDWLPWNIDSSIQVPEEYKNMPLQPLGDKQAFYDNLSKDRTILDRTILEWILNGSLARSILWLSRFSAGMSWQL